MGTLSLRQFLRRRGDDPRTGVRRLLSVVPCLSIRYLLTSVTFVQNLVNGDQVLPHLEEDLRCAHHEINVTMYLFYNDTTGQELANILIAKASDHDCPVRVRVLLNIAYTRMGHPTVPDDTLGLVEQLRAGGVEVLNTDIDYDKVVETGNTQFDADETDIRNTVKVDMAVVDHRKLITIDGTIGYCGSANVGAEYLYHHPFDPSKPAKEEAEAAKKAHLSEAWEKWHDGLVRFVGPIVPQFDEIFRERWVLNGGQDYQPAPFDPCHTASLVGHPGDHFRICIGQPSGKPNAVRDLFKQMIKNANGTIFIQNPYLYQPEIVDALVDAKQRNPSLRVDLMLPDKSLDDSMLSYDAQSFRYQRYLHVGINVFEYQNHFNHLKLATFDGRYALVGSANLNYRSLEDDRDFELVVLVDNPGFAQEVHSFVRDLDISQSKQIKLEDVEGFGSDLWPINCRDPGTIAAEELRQI